MWSFIFCFVIMTVWAMLMVEFVHPLIQELNDKHGTFEGCPQCTRATSSVMSANLLLFKTVIAGDSWGEIAVPVIERYPMTAIVFMGSLLTLVFGVLNLIVADSWLRFAGLCVATHNFPPGFKPSPTKRQCRPKGRQGIINNQWFLPRKSHRCEGFLPKDKYTYGLMMMMMMLVMMMMVMMMMRLYGAPSWWTYGRISAGVGASFGFQGLAAKFTKSNVDGLVQRRRFTGPQLRRKTKTTNQAD